MVLSYTPIFFVFLKINLHYLNIRKFSLSAKKREKKLKKVEFFCFWGDNSIMLNLVRISDGFINRFLTTLNYICQFGITIGITICVFRMILCVKLIRQIFLKLLPNFNFFRF